MVLLSLSPSFGVESTFPSAVKNVAFVNLMFILTFSVTACPPWPSPSSNLRLLPTTIPIISSPLAVLPRTMSPFRSIGFCPGLSDTNLHLATAAMRSEVGAGGAAEGAVVSGVVGLVPTVAFLVGVTLPPQDGPNMGIRKVALAPSGGGAAFFPPPQPAKAAKGKSKNATAKSARIHRPETFLALRV